MKYCIACGAQLINIAKFCNICGTNQEQKKITYQLPKQYAEYSTDESLAIAISYDLTMFNLDFTFSSFDESMSLSLDIAIKSLENTASILNGNNKIYSLHPEIKKLLAKLQDNKDKIIEMISKNIHIFVAANYFFQMNNIDCVDLSILYPSHLELGELIADLKDSENFDELVMNYESRISNYRDELSDFIESIEEKLEPFCDITCEDD